MPILGDLKTLCECEDFPTIPPTWCAVNYLLLKHAGVVDLPLGAVAAASGEAAVFSYNPHDFAPMYFGTIGGSERLQRATGYRNEGVRTKDAKEAFAFIKATIDGGKGVGVAGPEMGICYGYEDPGTQEERTVFGIANWGPGFEGAYTWEKLVAYANDFGMNEGFFTVEKSGEPGAPETIVDMIAEQAVVWQESHPATAYGRNQEEYGLRAARRYIDDVTDPEIRCTIDSPYINCHALLFQHSGRYWLGTYLQDVAGQMPPEQQDLVAEVGTHYLQAATELRRFQEYNILEGKSEDEIAEALTWLETAYQAEALAVKKLEQLRALRSGGG